MQNKKIYSKKEFIQKRRKNEFIKK
jgi:hypothetical protein